jgi:hypothetical protein
MSEGRRKAFERQSETEAASTQSREGARDYSNDGTPA